MPRCAIDSGCVDFIFAPKDIAEEIGRIQEHPYVRLRPVADSHDDDKGDEQPSVELGRAEQATEPAESFALPSDEKDFLAFRDGCSGSVTGNAEIVRFFVRSHWPNKPLRTLSMSAST
jgi:hypothetical protein